MPAADTATRPYVYAILEVSGSTTIGHLDASCRKLTGDRVFIPRRLQPDHDRDSWPCAGCVSLEQLDDWNRRDSRAVAKLGYGRSRGHADAVILPAEKKSQNSSPETKDNAGVGRYTEYRQPDTTQEDATMNTLTAPTAQQFATLKTLFADVISNEVPGMSELRAALLAAHKAGDLSGEAVDQAIQLLGNIVNPCNDDGPAPTYPALEAHRIRVTDDDGASQVIPTTVLAKQTVARPEMTKGMIVTNAAGQIVRLYARKADGKLYGKVRDEYGDWEYTPGAMKGARHLTAEEAASIGLAAHRCVFCSTALTDEGENKSVEVGYGPVCAAKYGLPWG